jgi:uroporphyrin-III C-methyltransferase/precorrin-2 dehydrogenase/sirohydrochlorin ferrochelatase
VVYDRLAPLDLLAELSSDVELVNAGKEPHRHALTQDEINAVIVERALAGKRVARLKGGDPYVLGRGSEEVLACVAAGVPVEVVPGITSAIAAPSAAGIPVTHRGLTTGFVVISGHEIADLESVVKSGLTVVVLMGVATLPELVAQFEIHGASASLPVAIIEKAFSHEQRTLRSTLADVVHDAERVGVSNPAVIVIGEVAALGAELPLQLASSR